MLFTAGLYDLYLTNNETQQVRISHSIDTDQGVPLFLVTEGGRWYNMNNIIHIKRRD